MRISDWSSDVCSSDLPSERAEIGRSTGRQAKRIAPTGYRRLTQKHAAWARVASVSRRQYDGTVYSLTVPETHTVVTSFGLVNHQCFPKDTLAMVRIEVEAGYEIGRASVREKRG